MKKNNIAVWEQIESSNSDPSSYHDDNLNILNQTLAGERIPPPGLRRHLRGDPSLTHPFVGNCYRMEGSELARVFTEEVNNREVVYVQAWDGQLAPG